MKTIVRFLKKPSFVLLYLLVLVSFVFSSCERDENYVDGPKSNTENDEIPSLVASKLKSAGFDISEGLRRFKSEGLDGYIVE